MVLGHQTHVHNMITSGVYEIHDAIQQGLTSKMPEIIKDAGEPIVKTMLFSGEAPLTDPVDRPVGFAAEFMNRGPRDSKGRSLRDFDLKHRLMSYPLSYLVYSKSFDAMPVRTEGLRRPAIPRNPDRTGHESAIRASFRRRPPGNSGDPSRIRSPGSETNAELRAAFVC